VSWPPPPAPQRPGPQPPAPQGPGWDGAQSRHPTAVQQPPYQPPPQRVTRPPAKPPPRRRGLLLVLAIVAVLAVAGVVGGIVAAGGHKHRATGSQPATSTAPPSSLVLGSPDEFCPLIDRADLLRLLRVKHLGKCADIKLTAQTNRAEYQSFAVTDPSAILMNGDTADIPATAITPTAFGTVEMRQDSNGTWKFRFYTS